MSETKNAVATKLRGDRCEERWPCNVELCACNAMDEGADEIDRLCRALDEMQNMLRDSDARLAEVEAENERLRLEKRPVAWRCKGYGDGWIIFQDEARALEYQEKTGCVMQGLYARAALAQTTEDRDD